ncbi:MAG: hypothetical protein FWD58_06235 [Firmicutes bacterium]|nr:hypothetical protein [Bacillota bacterium]
MGLDMYLISRAKENVQMAYWRKANAIHGYFMRNCTEDGYLDSCQEVRVEKENIEDLLEACKKVKELLHNEPLIESDDGYLVYDKEHEAVVKAFETLPPEDGFYFGPIEIGEYYLEDVVETIEICTNLLSNFDFENQTLYYHGWW